MLWPDTLITGSQCPANTSLGNWERVINGDVLKVAGDPLDDVVDDARYGIYRFITSAEKPRDRVIADRIKPLLEAGDATSAMVRYRQMIAESD
ncbi:MAG TPA: hypothetical protein VJP02_05525 [Candidatus Sulfotelmatobacter sp.]|nr:hypothetical protein [Candidatus Sulfotelmatobacter sp.]